MRPATRRGSWILAGVLAVIAALALVFPSRGEPSSQWRLQFEDEFDRTTLGDQWSRYTGVPRGDPHSRFADDRVALSGGALRLSSRVAADGVTETGGVSNWRRSLKYGKWEVRFRSDPSDDVTFHFLLWPQDENWPPEVDFAENFGGSRDHISGFVHWRDARGERQKAESAVRADFTTWHTVGVEWEPDELRYTLDGRRWATYTGDQVPQTPMWLGLQMQAGGCAKRVENGLSPCPHAGSPAGASVLIDSVKVWSRS